MSKCDTPMGTYYINNSVIFNQFGSLNLQATTFKYIQTMFLTTDLVPNLKICGVLFPNQLLLLRDHHHFVIF
jgi:hypothetical protein